jgi:hypothetical protein
VASANPIGAETRRQALEALDALRQAIVDGHGFSMAEETIPTLWQERYGQLDICMARRRVVLEFQTRAVKTREQAFQ